MNRRILAVITALVAMAAGSYVAYSALVISNNLNATGSINASPGLSVLDSNCSSVLTSLSFPPQPPAGLSTSSITVCIKNTGNGQFYLVSDVNSLSVSFSGLPATIAGSFVSTTSLPLLLHPGDTDIVTLTLTVANNGTTQNGTFSFTVAFTGYSTSTG